MGADVHVVTELITSLLGLIVFPYEEIRRSGRSLDSTACMGTGWRFTVGSSTTLTDLVRHLRNAISHRRLYFSSNSRELEDVEVRFHDCKNPNGPADWEATINGANLFEFVLQFADLLKQWERDYS
jgi:hypothetical protein